MVSGQCLEHLQQTRPISRARQLTAICRAWGRKYRSSSRAIISRAVKRRQRAGKSCIARCVFCAPAPARWANKSCARIHQPANLKPPGARAAARTSPPFLRRPSALQYMSSALPPLPLTRRRFLWTRAGRRRGESGPAVIDAASAPSLLPAAVCSSTSLLAAASLHTDASSTSLLAAAPPAHCSSDKQRPAAVCSSAPTRCLTKDLQGIYYL